MQASRVLFLVHIEEMFRTFFPRCYEDIILGHIESGDYDEVVALHSYIEDSEPVHTVNYLASDIWEWSWGYEKESVCDHEQRWIIPANGHEWTYVPEELRKNINRYKHAEIYVGGGAETECMQDWLDVLSHMGLAYRTVDKLVW